MQNHYEVLGIRKNADLSEIKNAYRKLAQEYHPDKNPDDPVSAKKFLEISEAYQVLSDQAKRARYDLFNEYETTVTFTSNRPRRPPPPAFYHFKNEKVEFSRKAYIQGSVVVIVLLLMVFIVPFILLKVTSKKQYELAINNYLAGRYYSALENIDMSIQDFGSNNSEACALAGVILVHKLKNYEYALKYIDKGLGYNPEDSLESEFHFLKGYCFDKQGNIPLALEEYHLVKDYSHTYDSSLFRQGVILSLRLTEYDSANAIFNELIDRNSKNYDAAYYQALVIQKQGKHELAIEKFKRLLSKNYEPAAVNYHIAWSEIKLDHIDLACEYLEKAQSYNLIEAKQLMNLYCKKDNSIFINPYH